MSVGCSWRSSTLISEVHGNYLVQIEVEAGLTGSYDAYLIIRQAPRGNGKVVGRELIEKAYSLKYDAVADLECIASSDTRIAVYMSSYYMEERRFKVSDGVEVHLLKVAEGSGCSEWVELATSRVSTEPPQVS